MAGEAARNGADTRGENYIKPIGAKANKGAEEAPRRHQRRNLYKADREIVLL
ncbi:MAG: hypothetical protein U9N36_02870 [Euryarchaeota archaeon]|nr:hypothetical protein [Euryarchaeota archaeon]